MKRFELPEMEINRFSIEAVITTSGGETPSSNALNSGSGNAAGSGIISDTVSTYSIAYGDMSA